MLIDSSVLIAYFYELDNQHAKAQVLLDALFRDGHKFYFTDLALTEILTVLNIRADYEIAKKIANYILNNEQFILLNTSALIFRQAVERFCQQQTKLSLIDITLLEISREAKMELHTFDKQLQKAFKG